MSRDIFWEARNVTQKSEPATLDDGGQMGWVTGSMAQFLITDMVEPSDAENASQAFAMESVDALALCGEESPGLACVR